MTPHPGLAARLEAWRVRVERELDQLLPLATALPERLHAAQRYSALGPGKRIRPALVYATAETLGVALPRVDGAACAVELIHAYSLVHDDLPAMDDDDLRRGRPTCHRAFDEATAILAGDSLQVLAFSLLATHPGLADEAATRVRLIDLLAGASGTGGMAGGQALDLAAAGRTLSLAEVEQVHALKTGALIRACIQMAASCAPSLSVVERVSLGHIGEQVGLAFQIQDDILDVEGDAAVLGKATGSDRARDKPTYPAVAGLVAARERVRDLHDCAASLLADHGWAQSPLAALCGWLLTRRH
ncbi:MAG TPA: farnesyl diphosphate synthase [Steroidobacteraceae bacterium]